MLERVVNVRRFAVAVRPVRGPAAPSSSNAQARLPMPWSPCAARCWPASTWCRCARASRWSDGAPTAASRSSTVSCSIAGTPLSGAELRSRLGPDAGLASAPELSRQRGAPHAVRSSRPRSGAANPVRRRRHRQFLSRRQQCLGQRLIRRPPVPSRTYRRTGARLAFGKCITVDEDEEVTDGVVAIGGRIRIAGRVRDEVVAIGGSVELLPTADVRGDITAIGGQVTIAPGARHAGAVHQAAVRDWPGWPGPRWAGRGSIWAARRAG